MIMKKPFSVVPQFLKSAPSMALNMAWGFAHMNKAKLIDYHLPGDKSSELSLVTFKITPRCNLRCVMCGQRGVTGTLKGKEALEENNHILPMEKYMELTDQIAHKAQVFYIWGGEPFMYPDFTTLARYMAERVPCFSVNTNGTYLEENAEEIVRSKWGAVCISLDGFEEVNDTIRGKGSYQKVLKGIEAIKHEKAKQNSSLPFMGVVTTISNLNFQYLEDLARDLNNRGLAYHAINLGTYMTEKIGQEHQAFAKENLDVDWTHWKGFANGYNNGISGHHFPELLQKVHELELDHPLITIPTINPKMIDTFYSELDIPVRDKCRVPWFSANINYNGDVHFCADYPDYIIGNINDAPLLELFNNDKARKFRHVLKHCEHGLFPACKRCYQIMLFGSRVHGF